MVLFGNRKKILFIIIVLILSIPSVSATAGPSIQFTESIHYFSAQPDYTYDAEESLGWVHKINYKGIGADLNGIFIMSNIKNTTFNLIQGHAKEDSIFTELGKTITQGLSVSPLLGRYTNSPVTNDTHVGVILTVTF